VLVAAVATLAVVAASDALLPDAAAGPPSDDVGTVIPGRYIVTLNDGPSAPRGVAARHGVDADSTFDDAVEGFAARMSEDQADALRDDPAVKAVEPDRVVHLADETLPTGIRRIAAGPAGDINGTTPDRDIDVAVIDSGADLSHPELNVAGGFAQYGEQLFFTLFCGFTDSFDDLHGHGTHVSGTIAAKDNATGVVGVAPGARIWAVRVIGVTGVGCLSDVIAGIDWVTANAATIEVANMSLGGFGNSPSLCTAIANSVAAGVVYAVAAGNEGQDTTALSPGNCSSAIAVSAFADYNGLPGGGAPTTCSNFGPDDTFANFSNFGSVVDLAAPGVCINSTFPGGYAQNSGTSMASPHAAGTVARFLLDTGYAGSANGPTVVQALADAGWTDPQGGPCGYSGDPDSSHEPVILIGECSGPTPTPTHTATPTGPTSTPTNTPTSTNTPTATPTPQPISALDLRAGGFHTCALTAANGVRCWGQNTTGQIGDGSTTNRVAPTDVFGLTVGVTAVSAGGEHTCALTSGGGVKCWGRNNFGQLGDGTTTDSLVPVDVSGLTNGVTAISAGGYHTCAVLSSGGLRCWGKNGDGQLGNGTTTNSPVPVDVINLGASISSVAAGGSDTQGGHTCAVTTGGGAKCWGRNDFGQVGDGTTVAKLSPVDVNGLSSGVAGIGAGRYHTCARTTSGGAKCWGWNISGQIGDGSATTRTSPVDVVGLTTGVVEVAAGGTHNCALIQDTRIMCWGSNSTGQLGSGLAGSVRRSPVAVLLASGAQLTGATGVTAGGSVSSDGHTCAEMAGAAMCWGLNNGGQLGDGTTVNRTRPVDVLGLIPNSPPPATNTPTSTPTRTNTPTPQPTSTASNTPQPTSTPTSTRTNTPVPPTSTPSNTPVPPTSTPTNTPTNTATNTPVPTSTPTNTPVPPTSTPTNTPLQSSTPTNTLVPTSTPTITPTRTPTNTATNTPIPTSTSTNTATNTPLPTSSPTSTSTHTPLPTSTPTNTATNTPLPTSTPTKTLVPTNTPTSTPTRTPTVTPTQTASNTPGPTPTVPPSDFYFVLGADGTVGGISVANEDIVLRSGSTFSLYFDGSDMGLAALNIDAFARVSSTELLLSFAADASISGLGTVDDSDVVKFTASSLGVNTAGTLSMYFDGSDVGLSSASEDVDAVELLPGGQLLFSVGGSASVTGVNAFDEDIIQFTPTSLGTNTAGTWAMYFDGSDVGLSDQTTEDIDGVALRAGVLYLSTTGAFSVSGASGTDEDVFLFTPTSLGNNTTGKYSPTLFFDGSLFGLGGNDLAAIELP
jgi:subtilisin family serine protease